MPHQCPLELLKEDVPRLGKKEVMGQLDLQIQQPCDARLE